MALNTCHAEFPEFELGASWSIFDLSATDNTLRMGREDRQSHAEFKQKCLCRLAKVFKLNQTKLVTEYEDYLPFARETFKRGAMGCCEAWAHAWKLLQAKRESRERHPGEELGKLLMNYGAFDGATTSGVEQLFSKQDQHFSPCRDHMLEARENDETMLFADHITAEAAERQTLFKACKSNSSDGSL